MVMRYAMRPTEVIFMSSDATTVKLLTLISIEAQLRDLNSILSQAYGVKPAHDESKAEQYARIMGGNVRKPAQRRTETRIV